MSTSDQNYWTLLERVIRDGIAAAADDYARKEDGTKLQGSIAGFQACTSREPEQLATLLQEARLDTWRAHQDALDRENETTTAEYLYWRCRELEIEWTCNVISAVLANQGLPVIVPPTARGVTKAAEIVGVGP